ncbi:unnamed protein product [Meganyctiphanes norvegica]|uniref:Gustatory receptor n=1 Tax=Meganyctiphanes norvegica TaxID=48144 RepID=A0AAV2SK05_MEGNR
MYGSIKDDQGDSVDYKKFKAESFEEVNKKLLTFFKYLGIFLVYCDNGTSKYKLHKLRYVFYYIFWFLWPSIGFISAYLLFIYVFKLKLGDESHLSVGIALIVFGFGVVPAFQTYVIKRINGYVPTILTKIRKMESCRCFRSDHTIIKWKNIFSITHQDVKIEQLQCQFHDGIGVFQILPNIIFLVTLLSFIGAWIYAYYDLIFWENVKIEFPYLAAQFFFLTLPNLTTWFCVSFLIWHNQIYQQIEKFVENDILKKIEERKKSTANICNSELETTEAPRKFTKLARRRSEIQFSLATNQINDLGDYVDHLQDIFNLLSQKILRYTFGVNFLVYTISSLYCTYHFITDVYHIFYTIPLMVSVGHMFLSCEQGHKLMHQYERTVNSVDCVLARLRPLTETEENGNENRHSKDNNNIEEMQTIKAKAKEDYVHVERLLENLRMTQPQAEFFGSFKINLNTFVTIIGFIISYSVLVMDLQSSFASDGSSTMETTTTSGS